MSKKTIIQLFKDSLDRYPDNILVWEKNGREYRGTTYREASLLIYKFAAGLMALGIRKGETISIISEGRSSWIISELGIFYAGGISVPISGRVNELPELQFRLNHAECSVVIVSKNQLKKILSIENRLPYMKKIVVLDTLDKKYRDITSIDEVYGMGEKYLNNHYNEFLERVSQVGEEDTASICYTSGTAGDPKGVILTHKNYVVNVEQASASFSVPEWYTSLLILPWDHSFAHIAGIYTLMRNGASMASVEVGDTHLGTLKNIPKNIREIRPVFLLSVPSLAQNFKKNIEKSIRDRGRLAEIVFDLALSTAYLYNNDGYSRNRVMKILLKPFNSLFDRILFSKIRAGFGGRLEFFIGGGSILSIELQNFFYAIGIPMYQGYGLTEASPIISANMPQRHKLGSSGMPVKNLDIKICSDEEVILPPGETGEICVRGENITKGYWKNPEATRKTIRSGWLYTGDLGYLDKDGFLYVLGRRKSLLIGDDGEKYSPEGIEEALISSSSLISQIMLYNNQSPYTIALIVLEIDRVKTLLKEKKLIPTDPAGQDMIIKLIESEINEYRQGGKNGIFPTRWLPSSFAVLTEGFTEENNLLNTTLKIVRGRIIEAYGERIKFMYTPEGKNIYNRKNLDCISRI